MDGQCVAFLALQRKERESMATGDKWATSYRWSMECVGVGRDRSWGGRQEPADEWPYY